MNNCGYLLLIRDKVLLVEAQRSGKVLNEEELAFLTDPRVAEGPVTQTVITHNAAYQADDLDAYDSDCEDFSTTKAVVMANLSSYGSYVLFEVPHSQNTHNDMLNQSVQEIPYSEQTHLVNYPENEISSDSNIIPYSQYLLETQNAAVQDTNSSAQQDAMILSVFEQLSNQVTNCNKVNKDNLIANESLSTELERYKERVKLLEERQNMDLITREKLIMDDINREKNAHFADFEKEINSLKQTLSEQLKEKGLLTETFNVLKNESNEKETKNIDKEIALKTKKAQQIRPMLYDGSVIAKETNVISIANSEETLILEEENFGKHFIPQQELSDEQAFWLQTSYPNTDQSTSSPVKIKAPRELLKMEAAVQQYFADKQCFEIQKKQFLIENDRLLDQIISQDIVNIVVNSSMDMNTSVNMNSHVAMNDSVNYVEKCNKFLDLEAELIRQHNVVEKDEYNRLSKSFSKLEQHCIYLEIAMQLNKEIFQKNNTSVNQTEHTFDHLFELNNLKAELQEKDTTIEKLKANIKRLNKTSTTHSMKKDIDEIETINIELEHREKVFVIIALKNDLRKLKGKDIVDNAAQVSNATTIATRMYKLDPVTLAPKDKNNRQTYIYYLKHTMEQAVILKEIVEQAKSLNPLDSASYSALSRSTKSSRSKSIDNTKNDRILQISSSTQKKNKVEDHSRIVNSMFDARHELCFLEFVSDMKRVPNLRRTFTLVGNACPLTRITATNKVPFREPIPLEVGAQESVVTKVYTRRPKVIQTVLWYLDSGCSKHMTGDHSQLTNFVHKFLGTIKFGNDQIVKIMGYGDYQIGNITISRVYYVEGLRHNLFSVGQFCDLDLEVAFRKHTCFDQNLEGVDLLSGSQETNLYTLSIGDMIVSSLISLLSKASKTKSWLWHR
ncbi:hypothetical protein Tco_0323768 [Tanacetum coccineum]